MRAKWRKMVVQGRGRFSNLRAGADALPWLPFPWGGATTSDVLSSPPPNLPHTGGGTRAELTTGVSIPNGRALTQRLVARLHLVCIDIDVSAHLAELGTHLGHAG